MNDRGFSLVEVVLATAILAVVAMSLVSGSAASHSSQRTLDRQTLIAARGESYLERLMSVPFGSPAEDPASSAELSEIFDEDDILGTITLHKLRAFGPAQFTTPASGMPGTWRIIVSNDLDGDGDVDEGDETQAEGRSDVLRIAVIHEGRLVTHVTRFDPVGTP
jgi:prepilin-type N-terminal cleavage/methylation domain-containing protein